MLCLATLAEAEEAEEVVLEAVLEEGITGNLKRMDRNNSILSTYI